jgi:hypothetical protein
MASNPAKRASRCSATGGCEVKSTHYIRRRPLLVCAAILAFLTAEAAYAQVPTEVEAAYQSIRGTEMLDFIRIIASDKFKGRASGSEQNYQTALMLAQEMKASGMIPAAAPDTFLQPFPVEHNVIDIPFAFELYENDTSIFVPKLGDEYVWRGFTGSGDVYAPTVFAGYGISMPEYDDYASVDVKGKVVVIMNGLPPFVVEETNWGKKYAGYKMQVAAGKGAIGVIFLGDLSEGQNPPQVSVLKGDFPYQSKLPAVKVSAKVANALSVGLAIPLASIQKAIDDSGKPMSFPLNVSARMQITTKYTQAATGYNVIGKLPGRHSLLKNRYVIVCAHTDHCGYQGGLIFNGADDNASGTSVLYALARAFPNLAKKPNRSILLVGFSGEEKGLIGSRYFVKNPPVPLNKIDAVINLDMVGLGSFVTVMGGTLNPWIYSAFASYADVAGTKVTHSADNPPSDQKPFVDAGIPAVMLLTIGDHIGYHTANDDAENLNADLLEDVARLTLLATWTLAEE